MSLVGSLRGVLGSPEPRNSNSNSNSINDKTSFHTHMRANTMSDAQYNHNATLSLTVVQSMATVTWSTKLQARGISLILSQQQLREKLRHACCSYQQSGCMLPPGHRCDQTCHHTIAVRAACWLQATLPTCPLTAASCAPPGYKSCGDAEAAAAHSQCASSQCTKHKKQNQAHRTQAQMLSHKHHCRSSAQDLGTL